MALVNNDLKRIIAYSTLSQLGYMFVAAGLGAYWIALFHLMTHAFFKSLLFLGAGNVMHAMHDELNIKKMGGLYGSMKATAILMSVASVALAGIYPFAGFFSKDKILEVAFNDRGTYQYFNVSKITMKQFLNAESKGAFLNRKIKDHYNYKKVAKITKKKKSRSMFIGRMLAKTELSKKYMENFK